MGTLFQCSTWYVTNGFHGCYFKCSLLLIVNRSFDRFDDFNLNSERESSPKGRKSGSRSRSPRARPNAAPPRRKSRDSRSAGETR